MLLLQRGHKVCRVGEVEFQGPGAIPVVGKPLVARLEVAEPLGIPPSVGNADLRVGRLDIQVEGLRHHPVPNILRDFGDALVVAVMAFQGKAVGAIPAYSAVSVGIVVLPDNHLLGLPVAFIGGGLVSELGEGNLLPVVGEQHAHEGAVQDVLLGDADNHRAGSLAVEILFVQDVFHAVGVQQLDAVDEFQVCTEDGELFTALDFFSLLFGKTGNHGLSQSERLGGFRLLAGGADNQFAAAGSNAGRGRNADHFIADQLEVGHAHAVRENDFLHGGEVGAVDGHRLSGDHLGREEHLDAQPDVGRSVFLLDVARCAHQGKRQKYSKIFNYLLHN